MPEFEVGACQILVLTPFTHVLADPALSNVQSTHQHDSKDKQQTLPHLDRPSMYARGQLLADERAGPPHLIVGLQRILADQVGRLALRRLLEVAQDRTGLVHCLVLVQLVDVHLHAAACG